MTKREPFAKLSGTLGYIEVAGCWLVPTTHTIWPSAFVSKINATHEARVKEECEKVRFETIRLCADKAERMGSEEIRNAIMFETGRQ